MNNQDTLDFNIPITSGKGTTQSQAQPAQIQTGFDSNANTNLNVNQPQTNSQQVDFTNFLQHANHPCVLLFTLIFKVGAVVRYMFSFK